MEQFNLNTQSSYSECFDTPKIVSPSPIRAPSTKVNLLIASEVMDLPSPGEDTESNCRFGMLSPFLRRNTSYRSEVDSLNELSSDSSHPSSPHSDCEVLSKSNSYRSTQMVDIFEDMFPEIIPRASNPIVKDANFRKHNHQYLKMGGRSEIVLRS